MHFFVVVRFICCCSSFVVLRKRERERNIYREFKKSKREIKKNIFRRTSQRKTSETSRSRACSKLYSVYEMIPRVFRDRSRLKTTKSAPFREAHGTTLVVFRPILNEETLDDLGTALAFEAKESCEMESLTVLIFLRLEFFFFKKLFPARLQRVRQVVSASLCSESLFFFLFCGACVYVLSASRVRLSLLNMIIILLKFLDALDMTTRKLVC